MGGNVHASSLSSKSSITNHIVKHENDRSDTSYSPDFDNHEVNTSKKTLSGMSSGILSQSSPEKQSTLKSSNFSPLSTDAVDGMHINSRISFQQKSSINETFSSRNGSNKTQQTQDDLQKMLSDFNDSLSQVIKVNKKLHDVLSKPPTNAQTSYSDDFDAYSSSKNTLTASLNGNQRSSKALTAKTDDESNTSNKEVPTEETFNISKSNGTKTLSVNHNSLEKIQSPVEYIEEISNKNEHFDKHSSYDSYEAKCLAYEKHFSNDGEISNTSIGSDIFAIFNRTSMEISNDLHNSTATWSSLGMVSYIIRR